MHLSTIMFSNITIEICAGGIEDVITASRFPIDRIELNSALELGGLTPSLSVLLAAKEHTDIPLVCMVRPRAAGFIYSEQEFRIMKNDAQILLEHGADGIVFGFLKPDHTIDEPRVSELVSLIHAHGKTAVFHRAFDLVQDADKAIQALIHCHVDRVLTSGLAPSAPKGSAVLKHLIDCFGTQIQILPGCGINADNVSLLLKETGSTAIHMTAKSMRQDDGAYPAVDARNIQAVMNVLKAGAPKKNILLTREDSELMIQEHYEKELF